MKNMFRILPVALLIGLAGCANDQPINSDFGNSVQHNMAMHIINPAPNYAGSVVAPTDGRRAALAIERYQKGDVIAPEAHETSELSEE